ncbi:signal recognition particle-docking protein FtsY [Propionibacterium sp. oral taxon 192 str. F0372]|uniref:signal recognition particle-docking protein FtsY n=1 Tax=Propionibacterium sp. oral taxon 192 TaxID=671222 RepID=UPI000352C7EA|nr:signal recognition particle-docking protein FtsY [Propionibacterium sp. oral taxon 192]EPH00255.1 signal recognition particle-docking protein FtsY [Propionibacterium sp. oral taxon 192 str. F0372]
MEWTFWIVIIGIVLVMGVAVGSIVIGSRRKQVTAVRTPEVPAAPTDEILPAPDSEPSPTVQEEAETHEEITADEVGEPQGAELESPEAAESRFVRLRQRLASSNNALARALADLLSSDRIDEETWDDFEMTLITSDLGVGPTTELVTALRKQMAIDGVDDPEQVKARLRVELVRLVDPELDRSLNLDHPEGKPAVVMMVGVNGTGKTTTVGKLGRVLVSDGKSVIFGAADTFRAAAAEQLTTWGERVGVRTVSAQEGADPASVAFSAVEAGVAESVDVVLVDTAGRLHNKVGLMDELGKVKRVIEKQAPVSEVLLVLDATTGQNGLAQARIFAEVVDVSGIVLTKLDGSAKGGIVVQVQRELGVPVKFIGLGEGADDLAPFDVENFVDGLLGD